MAEKQNFQNHTRWFPLFHFITFPILTIYFIFTLVRLYQFPDLDHVFAVVFAFGIILTALAARRMALTAQDRVIRLEETIRYERLLSGEQLEKARSLSIGQIIALRFAPDGELPDLVSRTLNGEFAATKDIKMAVKNWRGDFLRV